MRGCLVRSLRRFRMNRWGGWSIIRPWKRFRAILEHKTHLDGPPNQRRNQALDGAGQARGGPIAGISAGRGDMEHFCTRI